MIRCVRMRYRAGWLVGIVVGCGPLVGEGDDALGTSEGDATAASSDVDDSASGAMEGDVDPPPVACELRPIPQGPACGSTTSPQQIAQLGGQIAAIAADDRLVYVATSGVESRVWAIDKCGGGAVDLADSGDNPGHLDLSDDAVLWTDYVDSGGLYSVPKSGGPRTMLAGSNLPLALVVVGDVAYFGNASLWRVPLAGGEAEMMPAAGFSFVQLRWDGARVYWSADDGGGGIGYTVPSSGDSAIVVPGDPGAMLVDCEHAYFTDEYGALVRAPKDGGDVEAVGLYAFRMTQDVERVYYSDFESSVWALDKATTDIAEVATVTTSPSHVAVDATHVYWGDPGGGVWAAPKP